MNYRMKKALIDTGLSLLTLIIVCGIGLLIGYYIDSTLLVISVTVGVSVLMVFLMSYYDNY